MNSIILHGIITEIGESKIDIPANMPPARWKLKSTKKMWQESAPIKF